MDQPMNPAEELSRIRTMMERSSKITWLSGIAGMIIGVIAIAGTLSIPWIRSSGSEEDVRMYLFVDATIVLLLAIAIAFYFSRRLAIRNGWSIVTGTSKHFIIDFGVPFFSGGVFCTVLLLQQMYTLLPATMLIFYGIALFNVSRFAVKEIRYLAFTELLLGFFAGMFPEQGLNLWTTGFGVVHILYGARIYMKHEK